MSSFFESAISSFGQGASIGAQGASQAIADQRRARLTRELQAKADQQREEEKKLAAELRAKQEKDQQLGLFFRAMGSDNPDEIGAAAAHFGKLAASDPVTWGDYANELTTRTADAKKKRATEELLKSEQLKVAAEQNQMKTDLLRGELAKQKQLADPVNQEIGQALAVFEGNRAAPGVAASLLTPPQVPMAWDEKKGRLMDALKEQQGRIDGSGYAAPGGAPAGQGRDAEPRGRGDAKKADGEWTWKQSSDGTWEKTYKGSELPANLGAQQAEVGQAFVPDTRDAKEHQSVLADIEELHYDTTRDGGDPKEAQEDAQKLLLKLKGIHQRRIAMTPQGPERLAVANAAAEEYKAAHARFFAPAKAAPKAAETPAPKEAAPVKPELLTTADKLQPVGDAPKGAEASSPKGQAPRAAVKDAMKERAWQDDTTLMGDVFVRTPVQMAKNAAGELTKFLDAQDKVKERKEWRKVLEAKGIKNPSEAMIDELIRSNAAKKTR